MTGLLLAIVLFGTGPFLLIRLRRTKITIRNLKIFCAVNSLCAWIISAVALLDLPSFPVYTCITWGAMAVLCGVAAYFILKRQLGKTGRLGFYAAAIPEDRYTQQETEMGTFTVDKETGEVIRESPTKQPLNTVNGGKKQRLPLSTILLLFVCAVLAFVLFEFSYYARNAEATKAELEEKVETLEEKVDKLENEKIKLVQKNASLVRQKDDLQQQLEQTDHNAFEFFSHLYRIGFIVDGSKYYHRFDCDIYTSASEYTAHNVEYCVYLGYPPCPQCW